MSDGRSMRQKSSDAAVEARLKVTKCGATELIVLAAIMTENSTLECY